MPKSEHFSERELACKGKDCCGGTSAVSSGHCASLELLRMEVIVLAAKKGIKYGAGLKINSGFRCKKHNKAVGGAEKSDHIRGEGTDIKTPYFMSDIRFYNLAKSLKIADIPVFTSLGLYDGRIHVGTVNSPFGIVREWSCK